MRRARETPAGWITISELARERKVDKSAVSRRVARLESQGMLSTRTAGKAKLVNIAEFDRATAETVDAVRAVNGGGATGPDFGAGGPGDPVLAREQARRAGYDADLKHLDLQERLGRLVEVDLVRNRLTACAMELARAIDALPARAEALASAVTKEGVTGLRSALRGVARELRETLARSAERFAEGEPAEVAPDAAETEAA